MSLSGTNRAMPAPRDVNPAGINPPNVIRGELLRGVSVPSCSLPDCKDPATTLPLNQALASSSAPILWELTKILPPNHATFPCGWVRLLVSCSNCT